MAARRLRVAVIGAGAAGLCCARHILSRPLTFKPPVVFEMSGQVGGTWVYTEGDSNQHSSMYRDLRTNLPKEIMEFPDFSFKSSLPSFIHHTEVLQYLEEYTDRFGVRPYIRFNCCVTSVTPVLGDGDSTRPPWDVTSHTRGDTHPVTQRFDAVMIPQQGRFTQKMTTRRLRVAVIGAGAAGLCCARHILTRPLTFEPPVVFEMSGQVGGTWVYTEGDSNQHSSMYRDLRTNLPKEIMEFPDFSFNPSLPSFIHHTEVLQYLEEYTDRFGVRPYIRFNCCVTSVTPVLGDGDITRPPWDVTSHTRGDTHPVTQRFDAVMVCVGHYSHPYVPVIAGIETFQGKILHSHSYRYPEVFSSRNVVLLGSGPSGIDIAMELAAHADKVALSYRGPRLQWTPPTNVTLVPPVVRATAHSLICEDGTELEADTVIFCTGYKYNYPFLVPDNEQRKSPGEYGICSLPNEKRARGLPHTVKDSKAGEELIEEGFGLCDKLSNLGLLDDELMMPDSEQGQLPPLYKHLIHARYPTLCFIGACKIVVPFPLFHCQALFYLAVLEGKCPLPSPEEMLSESREEFRTHVRSGVHPKYLHRLDGNQWGYNDWLAERAGFEPLPPVLEKLFDSCKQYRNINPLLYRDYKFEVLSREEYRVITAPSSDAHV